MATEASSPPSSTSPERRRLRTIRAPWQRPVHAVHPPDSTTHEAAASPSVAATTAAVAAGRALVVADRAGFRLAPGSERSARGGAGQLPIWEVCDSTRRPSQLLSYAATGVITSCAL